MEQAQLQHVFEQLDLKVGLGFRQLFNETLVRTVCQDHHAILYLLEEQSEQLPYWCKVAFVVELHVGGAVQVQRYRFHGQPHRNYVIVRTNYNIK